MGVIGLDLQVLWPFLLKKQHSASFLYLGWPRGVTHPKRARVYGGEVSIYPFITLSIDDSGRQRGSHKVLVVWWHGCKNVWLIHTHIAICNLGFFHDASVWMRCFSTELLNRQLVFWWYWKMGKSESWFCNPHSLEIACSLLRPDIPAEFVSSLTRMLSQCSLHIHIFLCYSFWPKINIPSSYFKILMLGWICQVHLGFGLSAWAQVPDKPVLAWVACPGILHRS